MGGGMTYMKRAGSVTYKSRACEKNTEGGGEGVRYEKRE